jgi:hypothetical protein
MRDVAAKDSRLRPTPARQPDAAPLTRPSGGSHRTPGAALPSLRPGGLPVTARTPGKPAAIRSINPCRGLGRGAGPIRVPQIPGASRFCNCSPCAKHSASCLRSMPSSVSSHMSRAGVTHGTSHRSRGPRGFSLPPGPAGRMRPPPRGPIRSYTTTRRPAAHIPVQSLQRRHQPYFASSSSVTSWPQKWQVNGTAFAII